MELSDGLFGSSTGVTIFYYRFYWFDYPDYNNKFMSSLHLICDPDTQFKVNDIIEIPKFHYHFIIRTSYACPL
jgi:hypothetical protein